MSKENIKVAIRIKPSSIQSSNTPSVVYQHPHLTLRNQHRFKTFKFTRVHEPGAIQQQIFQINAQPLLQYAFKGHNCALLAYGQNGSGKSHTICGGQSQQSKGIIPRMIDHLAQCLLHQCDSNTKILIRVSYIEINNQEVTDLLSMRRNAKPQIVDKKREVVWKSVELKSIRNIEDIQTKYILGNRKRSLAYSKKYRKRQESTSIFTLRVQRLEMEGEKAVVRSGKIDIVELAASEIVNRYDLGLGQQSKRLYSLSEQSVKNVINSLVYADESTVPYDDSKVTKILRHCLGGDCKTTIIFHVNPDQKFYSSSLSTLRLAATARMVENSPTQTADSSNSLICRQLVQLKQLRQEKERARQELKHYEQQIENQKSSQQGLGDVRDSNEFISHSVVRERIKERQKEQVNHFKAQLTDICRKIQDIEQTFLKIPLKSTAVSIQDKLKYKMTLAQNNDAQMGDSEAPLGEKERADRQLQYDMQKEFQAQREGLLNALREAQEKYRFYSEVAKRALKKQQLDLLRLSAVYDPTTRTYQLPNFAIRETTLRTPRSLASLRASKSISNSISERKFMMTQLSRAQQKKVSEHIRQNKEVLELKKITSEPMINEAYSAHFHRSPVKPKPVKRDYVQVMGQNQYQIVSAKAKQRRLIRKKESDHQISARGLNSGSTQRQVKTIASPVHRFRFK